MVTVTRNYRPKPLRIAFIRKRDALIERMTPRRSTVISTAIILAGITIPALMALKLVPVTLFLGFVSLMLIAVGSVLALVRSGDI